MKSSLTVTARRIEPRHTQVGQLEVGTKPHHIHTVLCSLRPSAIPEGVCEIPCSRCVPLELHRQSQGAQD